MEDQRINSLTKHDLKSFSKSGFLGFLIGLAVIVPGISGATISIIFKLYDKLIFAFSILFKHFFKAICWLIPLALGAIIGILVGYLGVKEALNYIPFAIVCLFAGLMLGAFKVVFKEIKGQKVTSLRVVLFVLGLILPILCSVLSVLFNHNVSMSFFDNLSWYYYIIFFFVGIVISLTQLVPGLSASAFLMMIGYFSILINGLGHDSNGQFYWISNPKIIGIYVCLLLGFLLGLILFAKGLDVLFTKAKATSYFMIVGLSLGSIITMFYNPEINLTYQRWLGENNSSTALSMPIDLSIGIVLFIVGFIVSFSLVIYQEKNERKAISIKNN